MISINALDIEMSFTCWNMYLDVLHIPFLGVMKLMEACKNGCIIL